MDNKLENINGSIEMAADNGNNDNIKDISLSSNEGENVDAIKKFIEEQEREIQQQKCEEKQSKEVEIEIETKNNDEVKCDEVSQNVIDNEDPHQEPLTVASSVMQMILSDSEAMIAKKKVVTVSAKQSLSPEDKGSSSTSLSVGSKVEAKDFGEYWHAAEIVEVDYDEMEVLVHYENDTKKHDEWISVSSPRLRPIGSSSSKPSTPTVEMSSADVKNEGEAIIKEEPKIEEKSKLVFAVGERCLARWRDNRRFVATVLADLGNGHYEVIFDDGFQWKCTTSRMYKLKRQSMNESHETSASSPSTLSLSPVPFGAGPSSAVSPTPGLTNNVPFHTHLFDPTRDYLGSKSERREMKRKLNIKEIFNIGQKKRKIQISANDKSVKKVVKDKQDKVVKKPLKPKDSVQSRTKVKKDIPDAVASIIGTVNKEVPDVKQMNSAKQTIKSEEIVDDNINKSKQDLDESTEYELSATLDKSDSQDNINDVDPVVKEEVKLEKFEKQDDNKHEEVLDKMKEVITKLEDGINKVEKTEPVKLIVSADTSIRDETATVDQIKMKEVVIKLEHGLCDKVKPKAEAKEEEIKDEDKKPTQGDGNVSDKKDKPKSVLSKVKKVKKLRLLQERKVKKQVEKVKSELAEMKKQVAEMKKQMALKAEEASKNQKTEMPESFLLPGEWCCKWVNGQPVGTVSEVESEVKVDSSNKPGLPRRSVQVEDKRLPPGWVKHMVRRSLGHSAGKWDVVIVSPENRRFHTKTEMKNYIENSSDVTLKDYEYALMDFGVHLKLSRRMGWVTDADGVVETVIPLPSRLMSSTSPLVKRKKLSLNKSHDSSKNKKRRLSHKIKIPSQARPSLDATTSKTNVNKSLESTQPTDISLNSPALEDGYVYVGSLKVQILENLLRCPAEGCYKNFRNNTLLKMHIKHYHRELRKMMGATPKVLDLAYARTMPTKTEVTKSRSEDFKTIKVKITKPPKRVEEPKQEANDVKSELQPLDVSTTPIKTDVEKIPRSLDSPKLRNALVNKPVKRPKVLLPVRRPEPTEPIFDAAMEEDIEMEEKETPVVEPSIEIPELEPLDFETAISTHTVTKPIENKRKGEKRKKCFATISKRPTSEDEEWYGMNSDVDTRMSFPRSGTPDSRIADSKMEILNQPMSSESNEDQKDANMYMYTENGERIKIVHMKREEIINCHCGFREEDGLMVQCELCLCWQHALCHNIQKESEVPEKYTCSICLNPRRGRRSQRFLHDQDRLYEGLLPGAKPCETLRRSHELSGNLLRIQDALHALRVKYHVATKKDHPKLYLWAKDWENGELALTQEKLNSDYSDLNIMISNIGKENLPMKPDDIRDMQLDIRTSPSDEQDADRYSQRDNQFGSQSLLSGLLSSPGGASLELPISTTELERLAKSVQEQEWLRCSAPAPQPEAAIEDGACRERLLRHLRRCQALVDARLDTIEAHVAELESQDPSFEDDETADYFPRTKQTIQMLLRDLDTMEELGIIT